MEKRGSDDAGSTALAVAPVAKLARLYRAKPATHKPINQMQAAQTLLAPPDRAPAVPNPIGGSGEALALGPRAHARCEFQA